MAPDPFASQPTRAGNLSTTSKLRAWWLLNVKKWRLVHQCREPRSMTFGQLTYRSTWVLAPPQ